MTHRPERYVRCVPGRALLVVAAPRAALRSRPHDGLAQCLAMIGPLPHGREIDDSRDQQQRKDAVGPPDTQHGTADGRDCDQETLDKGTVHRLPHIEVHRRAMPPDGLSFGQGFVALSHKRIDTSFSLARRGRGEADTVPAPTIEAEFRLGLPDRRRAANGLAKP